MANTVEWGGSRSHHYASGDIVKTKNSWWIVLDHIGDRLRVVDLATGSEEYVPPSTVKIHLWDSKIQIVERRVAGCEHND